MGEIKSTYEKEDVQREHEPIEGRHGGLAASDLPELIHCHRGVEVLKEER